MGVPHSLSAKDEGICKRSPQTHHGRQDLPSCQLPQAMQLQDLLLPLTPQVDFFLTLWRPIQPFPLVFLDASSFPGIRVGGEKEFGMVDT